MILAASQLASLSAVYFSWTASIRISLAHRVYLCADD